MVLRKSFYIRWSAGRSPRVHEVNPSRDLSLWAKMGQNEKDIKKLKIIINNNFTNFIFCKIKFF